ncbi:metallophosphoesterase [Zhihengliuella halotolerans]|uniref:metallophosphoesterase n=1 Tax=Zhihengliuella halotolerans TaxID=370736 RepID=UPI000C80CE4A|nr:metallophosphoesterase [Zhihengliuella halotolerans]
MSEILYWSDVHLGHDFVARTRGFKDAAEQDAYLIDRWRATVTKRDTVWILGDVAVSSPAAALAVLAELPGTKHLVLGNHDPAHPMHRRAHSQQRRYFQAFESVQTTARHRIAGRDVVLSHFPYEGDHADRGDRYTQWRLRDEGVPLIHGHVHGEWLTRTSAQGTPQLNVGVDRWMDGPATAERVAALLLREVPA